MVIAGGFVLLAVCMLASRTLGAKVFLPLWFIAAFVNMWIGVRHAGYTWADELPIFLAVFGVPAVAAGLLWWKYG
jgi:hypothetical protein